MSKPTVVITDFIVNHTSDEHPWFIEARDPQSPKHDWYVWSDTTDRYADARVIFVDTHDSNWTWDERAGRYYWHRFFDHQPFPHIGFTRAQLRIARDVLGRLGMRQVNTNWPRFAAHLFGIAARLASVGIFLAVMISDDELTVFNGLFQKLV